MEQSSDPSQKSIKLDQYLKFMNLVGSGGQAKQLIQHGFVQVNGEVDTRRGRKLRTGDRVTVDEQTYTVALEDDGGRASDSPVDTCTWESPERVAMFAALDPDHRLQQLAPGYHDPAAVRALDIGCAGGRNTVFLYDRGFDVIAIDASSAMVAKTRERLAVLCGEEDANRRVREGRMNDLSWADDAAFDIIVALGIFQEARDDEEWERAIAESARVLRAGGRLLVAAFGPGTIFDDEEFLPVAGTRRLHRSAARGTLCLVDPATLDADMAAFGLHPEVPSVTVKRDTETSRRVTTNALYVKED